MKEINLSTNGRFANQNFRALVDDEDFVALSAFQWRLMVSDTTFYAQRTSGKRVLLMHREILRPSQGEQIDHIDHNGLNNQRSNLRKASSMQNSANRRSLKPYKGVSWDKSVKAWRVRIRFEKKNIFLGLFECPEKAHQAYLEASQKYFGDFSCVDSMPTVV